MAKDRQPAQGVRKTVVGVVTQGSLDPVLGLSRGAKRVHVNNGILPRSLAVVRSKVILPITASSFVIGNTVLEVKDDY